MTFKERLKQQTQFRMYTQKHMAEFLGIAPRSYQRYESGEREPKIDTLIQIADCLNVSLDDLVGRHFSQSSLVNIE